MSAFLFTNSKEKIEKKLLLFSFSFYFAISYQQILDQGKMPALRALAHYRAYTVAASTATTTERRALTCAQLS